MISASQIAQLTADLCRNKRKNFQPRCIGEEGEGDQENTTEENKETGGDNLSKTSEEGEKPYKEGHQSPPVVGTATAISPTSSPTMAESIFNDFISNLGCQNVAAAAVAAAATGKSSLESSPPPPRPSSPTTNDEATTTITSTPTTTTTSQAAALDLSAQELEQHQKQFTEQLLFLKNIRNLSLFYPHLSPHALMQQLPSVDPTLASSVKDDQPAVSSPPPPPSTQADIQQQLAAQLSSHPNTVPPELQSLIDGGQNAESSPIEQLLQLYNRDLYLKALQQQAQRNSGGGLAGQMDLERLPGGLDHTSLLDPSANQRKWDYLFH